MNFHPLEKDVNSFINSYPIRPPPLAPAKLVHFRLNPVAIYKAGQLKPSSYNFPVLGFSFKIVLFVMTNYYDPYDANRALDQCASICS